MKGLSEGHSMLVGLMVDVTKFSVSAGIEIRSGVFYGFLACMSVTPSLTKHKQPSLNSK